MMLTGSSDCPRPPEDTELRNIIDKLAQFVARNGQEFEQMTKVKQKDNPKFQFLYGGEFYHYYQYKVAGEQAIMRKLKTQADQSQAQMQSLKAQIAESERNLKAQHDVMMQQQQIDIEEAIAVSEFQKLKTEAVNLSLNLGEFEMILNALKDSCSKDAIANCKGWILNHFQSDRHGRVMMLYLLRRIKDPESSFTFRLHTLYLINDLLYHCCDFSVRKNVEVLGRIMADCIPFMYCHAYQHSATDDQRDKLHKLLSLWNSNKYLDDSLLDRLRDPLRTAEVLATDMLQQNAHIVGEVSGRVQNQYHQYERQHDDFVRHAETQLAGMAMQNQNAQQQLMDMNPSAPTQHLAPQLQQKPPGRRSRFDTGPPVGMPQGQPPPGLNPNVRPPLMAQSPMAGSVPPWNTSQQQQPMGFCPPMGPAGFQPPLFAPGPVFSQTIPAGPRPPLLSCPMMTAADDPSLKPTLSYYDLPAGLMAPLVKLTDCDYEPLDPTSIRLPPPMPPSERLIAAVEAFYSPPNHENPRDADGWEKLGLFEYFKAKEEAMQSRGGRHRVSLLKAEEVDHRSEDKENGGNEPPGRQFRNSSGSRSQSRSPDSGFPKDPTAPTTQFDRKLSPSNSRSSSGSRSKSRSPSSRRRSHSKSPSRSPKHPPRTHSRSRSRSLSPFPIVGFGDSKLDERNKGHQLLTKMGWGGKGLGAQEHGIEDPVPSGEVRDKQDLYKGVGVPVGGDAFEQFRRAKAGQYSQSMRKT